MSEYDSRLVLETSQQASRLAPEPQSGAYDREDIGQETAIKMLEKIDEFDEERGNFLTWAGWIARRTSVDMHRSETARTARHEKDYLLRERLRESTIQEILLNDTVVRVVGEAMGDKPEYVEAVLLTLFHATKTYEEIAKIEEIPLGTFKARAARGYRAIGRAAERMGINEQR